LWCGPELMAFVDHGGKLFERINGNEPEYFDKCDQQAKCRHSTFSSDQKA
jgi:hypothetical protein